MYEMLLCISVIAQLHAQLQRTVTADAVIAFVERADCIPACRHFSFAMDMEGTSCPEPTLNRLQSLKPIPKRRYLRTVPMGKMTDRQGLICDRSNTHLKMPRRYVLMFRWLYFSYPPRKICTNVKQPEPTLRLRPFLRA